VLDNIYSWVSKLRSSIYTVLIDSYSYCTRHSNSCSSRHPFHSIKPRPFSRDKIKCVCIYIIQ
jgi:hypothetical protein